MQGIEICAVPPSATAASIESVARSGTFVPQRGRKLPEPRNSNRVAGFFLHLLAKEETMFAKTVTAALAGTALLATIASAQTPTQTPTNTGDKATGAAIPEASLKGDWRASKVVGLKVYNDNNESVGSINDLLMDKGGSIKAVVLGVGGFLGMGEHLVAVPLDKVKFVNEPVAYTGTASTGGGSAGGGSTGGGGGGTMTRPPTTTGSANTGSASTSKPNPWYPDHAVFNANKDELKAMPEFKYSTE
jgi:sporulation protein YlmC with PRC-barrel domain